MDNANPFLHYVFPTDDNASKPGVYVYTYPHYLLHPIDPASGFTYYKVGESKAATGVGGRVIGQVKQAIRSKTALPEDPVLLRVYECAADKTVALENKFHEALKNLLEAHHSTRHNGNEWFLTSLEKLDFLAEFIGVEKIHRYDPYRNEPTQLIPKTAVFGSVPEEGKLRIFDSLGFTVTGVDMGGEGGVFTPYTRMLLGSVPGRELLLRALPSGQGCGFWLDQEPKSTFDKLEVYPGFWSWRIFKQYNAVTYFSSLQRKAPELGLSIEKVTD